MRSSTSTRISATDIDLLVAFLNGDCDAREELPRRLNDRLVATARRLAPDLARRGLHEDIVSEMWLLLLKKGPGSYDPQRSAPMTYLHTLLRRARRDVYAQNTPPGARTRPQKKAPRPTAISSTPDEGINRSERQEPVSLDSLKGNGKDAYDYLPSAADVQSTACDEIDMAHHLEWVQQNAPTSIHLALSAVCWNALTLSEAAKMAGTTKPTINQWVATRHITPATFGLG